MVKHTTIYRYCLDEEDAIVSVDQWWLAFAKENNAPRLNEATVIGKSLWGFIADEPTRKLYQELHRHVRSTGNPIKVPFRCDSPTLKRFMQLTISRHADDRLLYESLLLRTMPQRHQRLLDARQKRSHAVLTMCSFCKRSLIEPSGWLAMENISLNLRLYDAETLPGLRFTVCPDCAIASQTATVQQTSG